MATGKSDVAAPLLLLLMYGCAFGPDALAPPGTVRAWEYVAQGVEGACLWLVVLLTAGRWLPRGQAAVAQVAAVLGVILNAQRLFRLGFPLDRPPVTGGLTLGEALIGSWVWYADAALVFWGAAYVAQGLRRGGAASS